MKTSEKNRNAHACPAREVHPDAVKRAREALPEAADSDMLAATFRILGDRTRLGILGALSAGELCVCDICETLGMSQSAVSHQLRLLRETRLVKNRREGKNVFYSLDDDHVKALFNLGLEHVREYRDLNPETGAGPGADVCDEDCRSTKR